MVEYHNHSCQCCDETFECKGGDSCLDHLCRHCRHRLQDLQPAARALFEILIKRIKQLENLVKQHG